MDLKNSNIAVIGLGYVGLPLALEFGKKYPTKGYDINISRISELKSGFDSTLEIEAGELNSSRYLEFTSNLDDLRESNVYIVTVPTPIDKNKQPDLTPLLMASEAIGSILNKGDIVIYESTVYPGATEEDCIPVLERVSGLVYNQDFFAGYSPERINPGDKSRRLPSILKVTSGSTPRIADFVDELYSSIITAGTYKAESIKVAEAAKVIENTQRDVNIALINEFSMIFNALNIDTEEVLNAASTKWNFLPFKPGVVGGHCIGVDPYYLIHKAYSYNIEAKLIRSGRQINDEMGQYVVSRYIKQSIKSGVNLKGSRTLILGFSFKENCPDIRNTKIADIVAELKDHEINVDVYDPWVNPKSAIEEYGVKIIDKLESNHSYDGVIIAVAHQEFKELGIQGIRKYLKGNSVIYDLKCILDKEDSDLRL